MQCGPWDGGTHKGLGLLVTGGAGVGQPGQGQARCRWVHQFGRDPELCPHLLFVI